LVNNLKVNGTVVKKGTYDVSFDDATSELSILKNGKTIAKTQVRVEKRDKKARSFELRTSGAGDEAELTGITFGGSEENIMITPSAAQNKN
jgi:VCBS repeat-containing protein